MFDSFLLELSYVYKKRPFTSLTLSIIWILLISVTLYSGYTVVCLFYLVGYVMAMLGIYEEEKSKE